MKIDEFLDKCRGNEFTQRHNLPQPIGEVYQVEELWDNGCPYTFTVQVTGQKTFKLLDYSRPPDIIKLISSEWVTSSD